MGAAPQPLPPGVYATFSGEMNQDTVAIGFAENIAEFTPPAGARRFTVRRYAYGSDYRH